MNKHGQPCGGMDIVDVGLHIQGYEILDYNGIRYSEISVESLRKGFTVVLTDTSYKIKWFLINYESGSMGDEYPFSSTKVNSKNVLLKNLKNGDQFSIDCINITKDGVTSLSTGFRIIVTK